MSVSAMKACFRIAERRTIFCKDTLKICNFQIFRQLFLHFFSLILQPFCIFLRLTIRFPKQNRYSVYHVLNFRMWFKYGLKAQKLLAQGIALGIMAISKAPCKGKSFMFCLEF